MKFYFLLFCLCLTLNTLLAQRSEPRKEKEEIVVQEEVLSAEERETDQEPSKIDTRILEFFKQHPDLSYCRVVVHLKEVPGVLFHSHYKSEIDFFQKMIARKQREFLHAVPPRLFVPRVYLSLQYAIAGDTSLYGLQRISQMEMVSHIQLDVLNKKDTLQGRALTQALDVVNTMGYNGSGVTVAVLDDGIDYKHPVFGNFTSMPNAKFLGGYDFSAGDSNPYPSTVDDGYHSTSVADIILKYAPSAKIVNGKVFPNAYDSNIANAINWCVTNRNAFSSPIRIINMSLGGGAYSTPQASTDVMGTACANAVTAGIIVVSASGNEAYPSKISTPAAYNSSLSVGAVFDAANAPYQATPADSNRLRGERTPYSNSCTFLDLYGPSEQVMAAEVFTSNLWEFGGTSAATPAVSGCLALLLQADPSFVGNPAAVVARLQSSGVPALNDPSVNSAKIVQVKNAIQNSTSSALPAATTQTLTSGQSISGTVYKQENLHFKVTLPSGSTNFTVTMTGSGDCDLYVKHNTAPIFPEERGAHSTTTYKAPYSGGSNENVSISAPTSGDWYIAIDGYAASSNFDLSVSWTAPGGGGTTPPPVTPPPTGPTQAQEVEPNNSKTASNLISVSNIQIMGTMGEQTDQDWFKIVLGGTGNFSITLEVPPTRNYNLYLYRSSTLVGSSKLGTGVTEFITYTATTSGTYYIKITRGSGSPSTTEQYRLTVNY
jgi:hypothetical protein